MTDEAEPRVSPLLSQIILWVCFALIVVASVFTVVVPELTDQSDEDESGESAPAEEAPATPPADATP